MKKWGYILLAVLVLMFYTRNLKLSTNKSTSIDVLVNKSNKLNKDYEPSDLIKLPLKYSNENKFLRKEAAINFYKLCDEAKKLGYEIIIVSAYRSYKYQKDLYNEYKKNYDKDYLDSCCSKPGYSEHQTGLAIDVSKFGDTYENFINTLEFKWMQRNSYKYGFILRYPKGKEKITGFKYEPWHFRYVGTKVAKIIYENNLTLEEYHKKYK